MGVGVVECAPVTACCCHRTLSLLLLRQRLCLAAAATPCSWFCVVEHARVVAAHSISVPDVCPAHVYVEVRRKFQGRRGVPIDRSFAEVRVETMPAPDAVVRPGSGSAASWSPQRPASRQCAWS